MFARLEYGYFWLDGLYLLGLWYLLGMFFQTIEGGDVQPFVHLCKSRFKTVSRFGGVT
jgi:hypothetical protein